MRALRFYGPGDLRLEEVPKPEPGPGDVLVEVEVALIDGSGTPAGHEFAGIDVETGRRVVAADRRFLEGAYAEYVLVPARIAERNLLPVPDGLAPEVAAMVESLACCLHGVESAEIQAGQTVSVLDPGPIGLMLCAAAKDAGAHAVAVGWRPEGRELVPTFGGEPGDGNGADVVLTLRASLHHAPRHVRAALAFLASGAYPWEQLITHRVGLDEVPSLFADPPRDLLKAAVVP